MATTKSTDDGDAPLIELNDADIKKLIAKAKKKGYVTYDELNAKSMMDRVKSPKAGAVVLFAGTPLLCHKVLHPH